MRPSWDETWLAVADAIAKRSACSRRQVGAVIVTHDNRPVSTGYNGPPAGYAVTGSCSNFCPRADHKLPTYDNCVAVHAEANALLFAARSQYQGGTIYVTHICCYDCAKLIANSGLARVVVRYNNSKRDFTKARALLENSGLSVHLTERPNNEHVSPQH